jgi:hypothetical protein
VCSARIDECSTDFDTGLTLHDVDVDADTILPGLNTLVEGLGAVTLHVAISEALDKFSSFEGVFNETEAVVCDHLDQQLMMCDPEGDICGCPRIGLVPTGITFDWTRFGPNNLNLSLLPTPLCL